MATTPGCLACGALLLVYGLRLLRTVVIRWDLRRAEAAPASASASAAPVPAVPATPRAGRPGITGGSFAPPRAGETAAWLRSPAAVRIGRYGLTCVGVIVVAGAFWVANSFAAAYGRGRALDDAAGLRHRAEVVLYSRTPLTDVPATATLTTLSAEGKSPYRYRCSGLRILVESNGRLFLVPPVWQEGESRTLVVPYDENVRLALMPAPR
jgi:hypothetical protein